MAKPLGKAKILVLLIIFIMVVLIAAGMTALYLGRSPDPILAQSVQDEFSVPVNVKIVSTSSGNVAYIIPGEVKWDSKHKRLLYNLSNPKETALGFTEVLSNRDADALDFLISPYTRSSWVGMRYDPTRAIEDFRSAYSVIVGKPFMIDPEPGEHHGDMGTYTIVIIVDSGPKELELYVQPDGTWKI